MQQENSKNNFDLIVDKLTQPQYEIHIQKKDKDVLNDIALSNNNQFLAYTCFSSYPTIFIWDIERNINIKQILLDNHWDDLILLRFSTNNKLLFYAQQNESEIFFVDISALFKIAKFRINEMIFDIAISSNNKYFYFTSYDQTPIFSVWKLNLGQMKEQFTLKLQSDLNCMGIKRTDPACNSDISCKSIFCNDQKYLINVQCGLLQRTHYQIIHLKKGKIIQNWKSGYSCRILDIIQTDKDNILFVNFKLDQVNITLLWNLQTLTIFKMFKENLLNINIRAIIDFKIICYIRKDSNQDNEENQLVLRIIDVLTFRQSIMTSCIKVKQDFKFFNNGVAAFTILKGDKTLIKIFY